MRGLGVTVYVAAAVLLVGCAPQLERRLDAPVPLEPVTAGTAKPVSFDNCVSEADCLESGFDVGADGFSFANWQQPGSLDARSMIELFGRDAVCLEESGECRLVPAAQQWMEQANAALAAGRCEGLAVLAQSFFDGDLEVSVFDSFAQRTSDLLRDNPELVRTIDTLWATQLLPEVQWATAPTRELAPGAIADLISDSIVAGDQVTLGMYAEDGSGHSVSPVAVRTVNGSRHIVIYDNNFPGAPQLIEITDDRWLYAPVDALGVALAEPLSGGKGTLDVTPNDSRAMPAPAQFAEESTSDVGDARSLGQVLVTAGSPGVEVFVDVDADGRHVDVSAASGSRIEGLAVTPIRAGRTVLVGYSIVWDPTLVKDVTVDASGRSSELSEVLVSVDAPGTPRVLVSNATKDASGAYVRVSSSTGQGVEVDSSKLGTTQVALANGSTGVEWLAQPDSETTITTVNDQGVSEVVLAKLGDAGARTFDLENNGAPDVAGLDLHAGGNDVAVIGLGGDDSGKGHGSGSGSGKGGDEGSGKSGDQGSGKSGDQGSGKSGDQGSGKSGDQGSGKSGGRGSNRGEGRGSDNGDGQESVQSPAQISAHGSAQSQDEPRIHWNGPASIGQIVGEDQSQDAFHTWT